MRPVQHAKAMRITAFAVGVVVLLLSLSLGPIRIAPERILDILWQWLLQRETQLPAHETATITMIRLPRTLTAMLTGAALAGAGAVLQGLTRNPLVEPALIGISTGGAVGAALVIVFGGALMWLPAAAFALSLMVCFGVMALARVDGHTPATTLLLAGIAVNALASAILGLLTYAADDPALRTLTFWLFGSVARTGWQELALLTPVLVVCGAVMLRQTRVLDALTLGDAAAGHLGFAVERSRRLLIAAVALSVGAVVAYTGVIAFVGLVVPHVARMFCAPGHRSLLPTAMLTGAVLTVAADTVARLVVAPAELPIGVVTALCGAPFFIALLYAKRRQLESL